MDSEDDFGPVCFEYPVDPEMPPKNGCVGRMNSPIPDSERMVFLPTRPPCPVHNSFPHREYIVYASKEPQCRHCPAPAEPPQEYFWRETIKVFYETTAILDFIVLKPNVPFIDHRPRFLFHHAPPVPLREASPGQILIERTYCIPVEVDGEVLYIGVHRFTPLETWPEDAPQIYVDIHFHRVYNDNEVWI